MGVGRGAGVDAAATIAPEPLVPVFDDVVIGHTWLFVTLPQFCSSRRYDNFRAGPTLIELK